MFDNFFERHRVERRILENELVYILALLLEARGGVGKSTIGQLVTEALSYDDPRVLVRETDTSNQSMAVIGLGDGERTSAISANARDFAGKLLEIAGSIGSDRYKHALVDFGARDEEKVRPLIADIADEAAHRGGKLVVIRPFTTSLFVKANAASFFEKVMTSNMRMIIAFNLGLADDASDFDNWKTTKTRQRMLEAGVEEIEIEHVGIRWANAATDYKLRFVDIARGDFSRAGVKAKEASEVFDKAAQLHFARWVLRQTTVIHAALAKVAGK